MNRTVVRFELQLLIRDRSFLLLATVLAAAVALGAVNGTRWVKFQQQTIDRAKAEEVEKLAAAKADAAAISSGSRPAPRGWWSNPADTRGFAYGFVTTYAIKPPNALGAVAVGQSDLLPYYFKVNAGRRSSVLTAYETESPRRLLLGRFDLAFVVVFLLPLALCAAGYGVLAAEREGGRLALLLMHGMSVRRLALIRVLLRSSVLLGVTIVTALVTLLLAGIEIEAGTVHGLLQWSTVVISYGSFWAAATLVVAAFARSSGTAALSLAGLWLMLVIIAPWTLNLLANLLHPLPSRAAYVLAQRDASDAAEAQGSELLGRYLHDHPELAPPGTPLEAMHYSAADIATTEHVEAQLWPVEMEFDERLLAQQLLIDRWQWLSPAVLAQQAFNEIAGAGWSRHSAFMAQANAHIDSLRAYFNPSILKGAFRFSGFDEWPRYAWREPARGEAQRRVRWALLGLLLPAVAAVVVALTALKPRHGART